MGVAWRLRGAIVVVRCSREGGLDEDNVVEMWTGRRDVKQCTLPGWPDILDARPLLVVSFRT